MTFLADDGSGVGTPADMAARLRSTLPAGWFPVSPPEPISSSSPVLDGLLAGLGTAWSFCFDLLSFSVAQTRIRTAIGGFLDLISGDFFGSSLARRTGESDDSFRARIGASLIARRGTRQAVCDAVLAVTSAVPLVFEPMRGMDCGGYAGANLTGGGGGRGYGSPALRFGSALLSFQYFVRAQAFSSFAPGRLSAGCGRRRAAGATRLQLGCRQPVLDWLRTALRRHRRKLASRCQQTELVQHRSGSHRYSCSRDTPRRTIRRYRGGRSRGDRIRLDPCSGRID